MRPGRLDRILSVGPPDAVGRQEILRIQTKKMTIELGLDFEQLSGMVRYTLVSVVCTKSIAQTEGCSGAELAAVCQEAAMNAMREDRNALFVSREHFIDAARRARRGITVDVIAKFKAWREKSGLTEI